MSQLWQFSMGYWDLEKEQYKKGDIISLPRGTAQMIHFPKIGDRVEITWRAHLRYKGIIQKIKNQNYITKITQTYANKNIKQLGYRRNWIKLF